MGVGGEFPLGNGVKYMKEIVRNIFHQVRVNFEFAGSCGKLPAHLS